jgi:hypothetical protein
MGDDDDTEDGGPFDADVILQRVQQKDGRVWAAVEIGKLRTELAELKRQRPPARRAGR